MATSMFDSIGQQGAVGSAPPEAHKDLFAATAESAGAQLEQGSDATEAAQRATAAAPSDAATIAAKVGQSATFGFGADVVGLFDKESGKEIRSMEDYYNKNHPLAAAGIDLAVGMAQSLVLPGSGAATVGRSAASIAARTIGRGAIGGALTGLGSGGSLDTRLQRAAEGGIVGGAAAGVLGGAANVAGKVIDRTGAASQARQSAEKLQTALAKDGVTPDQFAQAVKANPNLRLVDISPSAAEVVRKAAKTGQKATMQAQDATRMDAMGQESRLREMLEPLAPLRDKLTDNLQKMAQNKNELYKQSNIEIVPMTRELSDVLRDPTVKPFLAEVSDVVDRAHKAGTLEGLPKYRPGKEVPTVALNELQKRLGIAADNAVGQRGSIEAKTLWTLQDKINSLSGSTTLSAAQAQTAQHGAAMRAQEWGGQFSKGLKSAPIEDFQKFSPEAQEYARMGVVGGLEDYLRNRSRIPEGTLDRIADNLQKPEFTTVLGKDVAADAVSAFRKEAERARTSGLTLGGAGEQDAVGQAVAHTAALAGKHHVNTAIRLLHSVGMSDEQAQGVINLATTPNGFAKLEAAGVSKSMLDKLRGTLNTRGLGPGKAAAGLQLSQQERGPSQ